MTSESGAAICCFCECRSEGPAALHLEITPPPDGVPVVACAHEACLIRLRDQFVEYDNPGDHGRIPSEACCAFCGDKLPIVGRHPFVLDVGNSTVPQRLWAHAECLTESLVDSVLDEIKKQLHRG